MLVWWSFHPPKEMDPSSKSEPPDGPLESDEEVDSDRGSPPPTYCEERPPPCPDLVRIHMEPTLDSCFSSNKRRCSLRLARRSLLASSFAIFLISQSYVFGEIALVNFKCTPLATSDWLKGTLAILLWKQSRCRMTGAVSAIMLLATKIIAIHLRRWTESPSLDRSPCWCLSRAVITLADDGIDVGNEEAVGCGRTVTLAGIAFVDKAVDAAVLVLRGLRERGEANGGDTLPSSLIRLRCAMDADPFKSLILVRSRSLLLGARGLCGGGSTVVVGAVAAAAVENRWVLVPPYDSPIMVDCPSRFIALLPPLLTDEEPRSCCCEEGGRRTLVDFCVPLLNNLS